MSSWEGRDKTRKEQGSQQWLPALLLVGTPSLRWISAMWDRERPVCVAAGATLMSGFRLSAIGEFREMKMQPPLERALRHREMMGA